MSKLKIKIKDRWTDSVLFEYKKENNTLKDTMEKAIEEGFDMRGANLRGANLRGANLGGTNLRDANLRGADLEGANLGAANLEYANLRGACMEGANLGGADLGGANLGAANSRGANLEGTNLRGADLRGANLEGAYLRGADLRGANLEGANLGGANLEGAYLGGAYLGGAYLEGAYIYVWDDDEPNIKEIVENIENNSNLKIKSHYINKHILSPYYLTYWKKGLIIDEYEIVEPKKEVKEMTIEEIEKVLGYSVKVVGGSDENEQVFKNRIYFNNCGFGNDYDWNINYGSRKD